MATVDEVSAIVFNPGDPSSKQRTIVVRGVGSNEPVIRDGVITISVDGTPIDVPVQTVQNQSPPVVAIQSITWPGVTTQTSGPIQPFPDQPTVRHFTLTAAPDPV